MASLVVKNAAIFSKSESSVISLTSFLSLFSPSVDKAYTTMRTCGSTRVFVLEDHINRLSESLTKLGAEQCEASVVRERLIPSLSLALGEWHGMVKSSSSSSSSSLSRLPDARLVVAMWPPDLSVAVRVDALPTYADSVAVEVRPAGGRQHATLKSTQWVEERKKLEAVKAADAHEVILAADDEEGVCYEGLSSNFAVLSQPSSAPLTLYEAPVGTVLQGTVMKFVHSVFKGTVSSDVGPQLSAARAGHWKGGAFIASTTRGVLPVHQLRIFNSIEEKNSTPSEIIEIGPPSVALAQLRDQVNDSMIKQSESIF